MWLRLRFFLPSFYRFRFDTLSWQVWVLFHACVWVPFRAQCLRFQSYDTLRLPPKDGLGSRDAVQLPAFGKASLLESTTAIFPIVHKSPCHA